MQKPKRRGTPRLIRVSLKRDKVTGDWILRLSQGGRTVASGQYDTLSHAHEACDRLFRDAWKAINILFNDKENL